MSYESIVISDATSGARAKILPGIGFNCYSFEVPVGGKPVEVLWCAPEFLAGQGKASHSGIPILFPFAGRIGGTAFVYEGKSYALDAGDGQGNAIHGFVLNRAWRVTEQSASRAVGTFQASVDDQTLIAHWPADFRITAAYQVAGSTLTLDYAIENPDDKPLPFGLGTHPYFRVPLGGASADDCRVTVPVTRGWELKDLMPTGTVTSPPEANQLAHGMTFASMQLDNIFGGIAFKDSRGHASVHDPRSGRTMTMTFADRFTTCVVYNPPHREAVCIEPYTTVPDPFRLADLGIDPHLVVLAPGESIRMAIEIRLD